ncbi:hypothetical protein Hanom_Chr11g01004301 [Helianthus anomalus]
MPRFHSQDKVNLGDLFFLYCLLRRQPRALTAYLVEHFAGAYRRQQCGKLHGGSYVTTNACSLGFVHESEPLLFPTIPLTTLGRALVWSMHLTQTFDGIGLWFRTRD